jgi:hypothetical protein
MKYWNKELRELHIFPDIKCVGYITPNSSFYPYRVSDILYICHTIIHRKLQNVVYMKKIDVKVIKLYTIYTSTVNREMELDGRTNSPIYLPQLWRKPTTGAYFLSIICVKSS